MHLLNGLISKFCSVNFQSHSPFEKILDQEIVEYLPNFTAFFTEKRVRAIFTILR